MLEMSYESRRALEIAKELMDKDDTREIMNIEVRQGGINTPDQVVVYSLDGEEIPIDADKFKRRLEAFLKNRPPLGLTPRFTYLEDRIKEINEAMIRYMESNKPIPNDWNIERNTLLTLLKDDKNENRSD